MRLSIFFTLVVLFVISPNFSDAQRYYRDFQDSPILNTRFTRDMVWDVQRFPVNPIEGREWRLSGLKPPFDVENKLQINWGRSGMRYLMFDITEERPNTQGSLYDEKSRRGGLVPFSPHFPVCRGM